MPVTNVYTRPSALMYRPNGATWTLFTIVVVPPKGYSPTASPVFANDTSCARPTVSENAIGSREGSPLSATAGLVAFALRRLVNATTEPFAEIAGLAHPIVAPNALVAVSLLINWTEPSAADQRKMSSVVLPASPAR